VNVPIIESLDRFCVYGVATDYETMIELVRYRLEELNTTHESVDDVSGLHGGYTSKLVAPTPIKSMGKASMGPMLQTLGLALIVVRDDAQFARIKDRLARRERPRQVPNGSSTRPTWLFTRKTSLKMQALRSDRLSEKQRQRIARKAGRASGRARRRRAKLKAQQTA
jgi:hypothetical protein